MLPSKLINWAGLAAVLGGVLWAGLVTLGQIHDFWESPLGQLTYESFRPDMRGA